MNSDDDKHGNIWGKSVTDAYNVRCTSEENCGSPSCAFSTCGGATPTWRAEAFVRITEQSTAGKEEVYIHHPARKILGSPEDLRGAWRFGGLHITLL